MEMEAKNIRRGGVWEKIFHTPQKTYESAAYWLLAVMIWMPIIQSPTYLAYIFSGSLNVMYGFVTYAIGYSFYGMAVICIFYSLWRLISWGCSWRRGELRFPGVKAFVKRYFLGVSAFAFLILALISTLLSNDVLTGIFGHHQRTDGFLTYTGFLAIVLTGSQVRDEKKRASLLKNILIVMALCSVLMYLQLFDVKPFSEWFNMEGAAFFRNSNHFGYILAIATLIASGAMFAARQKKTRVLAGFALAFFILALLYNDTLGAHVGVLCAFVLMGFLYKPALGVNRALSFLPLLIYAALFAFSAIVPSGRFECSFFRKNFSSTMKDLDFVFSHLRQKLGSGAIVSAAQAEAALPAASTSTDLTQGAGRLVLWKFTLQLIAQKPLFGWGGDQTRWEFIRNGMSWAPSPHNEYLNLASFFGIPAALCYYSGQIWLLVRRLRGARTLRRTTLVALGAAFAYAVSAFFGVSQLHAASYFYLVLGLVAADDRPDEALTPPETPQPRD